MYAFDFVNDPITAGQIAVLRQLLGEEWTDKARDGFLAISGRFVDETSTDRTEELQPLFRTESPEGRRALRDSLETLLDFVGSLESFEAKYPVYINDPVHGSVGLFPQLPIVGIHKIHPELYRLFDTNAEVRGSPAKEKVRDYIVRTGKLPRMEPFNGLVLRNKPHIYWCSHERYESPLASRDALQILESWKSDCRMRATLPSSSLNGKVFVAYSGVVEYPPHTVNLSKNGDVFAGYNVEVRASDHPELPGGGLQVGVVGEPLVALLEAWSEDRQAWVKIWTNTIET
jgi:hypothetical protein